MESKSDTTVLINDGQVVDAPYVESPTLAGDFSEFPFEAFTGPIANLAKNLADARPIPRELPYLVALSVATALAGKRIAAHNHMSGFKTPPNLGIVPSLPTGGGKSIAVKPFLKPLLMLEETVVNTWRKNRSKAEAEKSRREISRRGTQASSVSIAIQGKAAATGEMDSQDELAEILESRAPKWIDGAPTIEALQQSTETWDECSYVCNAEGEDFVKILQGKYSKGASAYGVVCSLISGDALSGQRVGRVTKTLKEPALSMFLAVQNDIASSLRSDPEARTRGLVGRLLWVKLPNNRHIDPNVPAVAISEEVMEEYARMCRTMFERYCSPDSTRSAVVIPLADDAARYLYRRLAEDNNRQAKGDLNSELHVRSVELITKIALGLHLLRHGAEDEFPEIPMVTVLYAERLYEWCSMSWAESEQEDQVDLDNEAMCKVAKMIDDNDRKGATAREIYRKNRWSSEKGMSFINRMIKAERLFEEPPEPGEKSPRYHLC